MFYFLLKKVAQVKNKIQFNLIYTISILIQEAVIYFSANKKGFRVYQPEEK